MFHIFFRNGDEKKLKTINTVIKKERTINFCLTEGGWDYNISQ